ncbi:Leucine-rich repeat-containing protein [Plasmodiophora brassicae]
MSPCSADRFEAVLLALQSRSPPRHVDLSCAGLTFAAVRLLAERLACNRSVRVLLLKGNCLGDRGAMLIASMLKRNRALRRLDLSRNCIGPKGVQALCAALDASAGTLTNLDLSYNGIMSDGAQYVAQSLRQPSSALRWLSLRHNALGDAGVTSIADSLHNHRALVFLNLSRNQMTWRGARAVSRALQRNQTLDVIDLSDNDIRERGAAQIARCLPGAHIKGLLIARSALHDDGVRVLLELSASLTSLDVSGNGLTRDILGDLRRVQLPILKATIVDGHVAMCGDGERVVDVSKPTPLPPFEAVQSRQPSSDPSLSTTSSSWAPVPSPCLAVPLPGLAAPRQDQTRRAGRVPSDKARVASAGVPVRIASGRRQHRLPTDAPVADDWGLAHLLQ